MATLTKETTEARSARSGIVPNIISGLATGLFSISEGMAYAQLAGVNPVYGRKKDGLKQRQRCSIVNRHCTNLFQ